MKFYRNYTFKYSPYYYDDISGLEKFIPGAQFIISILVLEENNVFT